MFDLPDVKYARSRNTTIAYSQWGEGEQTVLFTPPFVSNIELMWDLAEWERVFEWAGKHHRILIMDKRGVGLSDRTSEPSTLSDYVSDVISVMDAEGLTSVNIVGQSEGGVVGMALAAQFPERVKKLCVVGSPAMGIPRNTIEKQLRAGEELPTLQQSTDLWRELIRTWGTRDSIWLNWFAPSVSQDKRIRRWWSRFERQSCSPGALLPMVRSLTQFDLSPLLQQIKAPTLVCHTNSDLVARVAEGRTLSSLIPGAVFKEWDNPDHMWGFAPSWRDNQNDLIEFITGERPGSGSSKSLSTVLFTDIVGSTKLASQIGDVNWRAKLEFHDKISQSCFGAWGGRIVKHTGDGNLAMFQSPLEAANAVLELSRDLQEIGVSIRAGVHIGQIEVHDDGDVSGIAVNIASRVQSLANPDEVLVSQTIRDMLMGSEFSMNGRGEHMLKGVEGFWQVFSLSL